jgi:hypothetical protein
MRYPHFDRRWWAGFAAVSAFLAKRPEVMKGVANMVVLMGKSALMQYIQTM